MTTAEVETSKRSAARAHLAFQSCIDYFETHKGEVPLTGERGNKSRMRKPEIDWAVGMV